MPTAAPGATSTYGLTVGIKLDVEPMIAMISPTDAPHQGSAMGATDAIGLPTGTVFEKKYEWLDETILTPRSTIAATSTTGDAFVTVASGDGLKFQTGDMLLIGSEYVRVTGYSLTTSDILLVTRAISGSAATVATSADVIGVGSILPEGSDPPTARYLDRNNRYNYTEIFGPVAVKSTNSDLAIQKYGITNEFDHQLANRIKEQIIAIDQASVYGVRLEDTSNKWRSMAGLLAHITSVVNTTTTQLTLAALNTMLATIYGNGGTPDVIELGAVQKGVVSTFTSSGTVQVMRADRTAGHIIDVVENDFATLHVLLNRWFRTADLAVFSRDQAEISTLRPLQYQPLAITGDAVNGMVVGEKGFKFRKQAHAGKFTALT